MARRALSLTALVACAALAPGCASDPEASGAARDADPAVRAAHRDPADTDRVAAEVERRYVIGPAAGRTLGYRIAWQYPTHGYPVRRVAVQGDAIFVLDEQNLLTRLRREEGDRLWRIPVAPPVEQIYSINYVPAIERVYLLTGGSLLELDAASGSRVGRQRLAKIANTQAVPYGQLLLYGSRNGQLTWHAPDLETTLRAYQVSSSIQIPPVLDGDYVVTVGADGRVMCLRADAAAQVWSRRTLGPVVAPAVAGDGVVYVASLDHHLRAYELASDRSPLWEYLTESPLRDPPTLLGDRVYQQVPTEGLVCLEAVPLDSPGGVVIWRARGSSGNVVAQHRNTLIVWNDADKRIELIDAGLGAVVDTVEAPDVDTLMATDARGGELVATGLDGRVIRLLPRS